MKKLLTFLLIVLMVTMAACSEKSTGNDAQEKDPQENEAVKEDTETDEQTSGEVTEGETTETSEEGEGSSADAEQILRKSAEAMEKITSFLASGEITENTTRNGQNEIVETTLSVEMILGETPQMYTQSNTTSNIDAGGEMEMYLVKGIMYMKNEGQWFSMPMNSVNEQAYERFKVLDKERLDEYLNQSQWFEVKDNGDHYLLFFNGNDEQYKSVVLGATEEVLGDTLKEHFENMKVNGRYEMRIDKDTFYMTGYATEYKATTSGELGEVETYHKSSYKISNVNEYEEITVPEEVINQAQSLQ